MQTYGVEGEDLGPWWIVGGEQDCLGGRITIDKRKNFKLRLGALITRSVGLSVCLSVCRSVGLSVLQKLQKNYKTLQNPTKPSKPFRILSPAMQGLE